MITLPSVLVVDDGELMRSALVELLTLMGFRVVGTAFDGCDALTQVAAHKPDAVLMDLKMPCMDGLQAARAILADSPATTVVILTAFDDPALAIEGAEVGVSGFLLKGCPGRDIRDALLAGAASRVGH